MGVREPPLGAPPVSPPPGQQRGAGFQLPQNMDSIVAGGQGVCRGLTCIRRRRGLPASCSRTRNFTPAARTARCLLGTRGPWQTASRAPAPCAVRGWARGPGGHSEGCGWSRPHTGLASPHASPNLPVCLFEPAAWPVSKLRRTSSKDRSCVSGRRGRASRASGARAAPLSEWDVAFPAERAGNLVGGGCPAGIYVSV